MATLADIIKKEYEIYATENHQRPDLRYFLTSAVLTFPRVYSV